MTIQELGQLTKQKYPQYNDVPDQELGQMILQEYPSYGSQIDTKSGNLLDRSGLPENKKIEAKPKGGTIGNVLKGVAKGVANTVTGISSLGEKGIRAVLPQSVENLVVGKKQEQTAAQQLIPQNLRTPVGTAQKIGFGAEQIAEFFAPSAAISKVGKLGTLARAGAEALGAGGVTALQGGSVNNVGVAGALAGGIPVVGKALSPITKMLSQKLAPTFVNRTLRPLAKQFSFGKDPGLGIVQEKIKANTLGQLEQRVLSKKQEIGKMIESALSQPSVAKKIIDVQPLLSPIDDAIKKAVGRGEQGLIDRLLQIKKSMTKEFDLVGDSLVEKSVKNLKVSPLDAQKLKRELGEATRWTGQSFDDDVNKVRVAIYRNIDSAIDQAAPGVDKLNSRWANMLSAEKSIERIKFQLQTKLLTATEKGIGAAFGVGAAAAQGDLSLESGVKSIIVGLLGSGATRAVNSTAFNTRVAQRLSKLNPDDKQKVFGAVSLLKNIFLGVGNR